MLLGRVNFFIRNLNMQDSKCFGSSKMASTSSKRKRANVQNVEGLLGYSQVFSMGPDNKRRRSALARSLLTRYFWGEISAISVQTIAAAAIEDGMEHEEVMTLSVLGTDGAYTGAYVIIQDPSPPET